MTGRMFPDMRSIFTFIRKGIDEFPWNTVTHQFGTDASVSCTRSSNDAF